MAYVSYTYIPRHLKGGLAWATDKRLRVVSNIKLFKTVIYSVPLRNYRICHLS